MATVQKLPVSTLSTASSYASRPAGGQGFSEQFPAGLRVLVVDDDTICLKILEQMLRKCLYQVTTCCRATIALSLLRERKGGFDVVISDVHMPDMDGFKLLEHVGLEMDLPVIMMSADGRTNVVMKGIKHGACDYLIKPVRIEELKNIWQHVIRKRWNGNKEIENSGSIEDTERQNRRVRGDEGEYASSVNEGTDGSSWKAQKKRKDSKEEEDDGELDSDDPSSSKKPRVVWSVELHQQFVGAVNQLGIEKAVPKRILELMNVPGLTRENVASHLQKFRLYLKRLSGVNPHSGGIPSPFCGPLEPDSKLGPLGRLDFHALAASGQIAPQTLAALQVELLGHPTGCRLLPGMDPPLLLQTSQQGPNCISLDHRGPLAFGQPLVKYPPNVLNQFPQSIQDISSGFTMWTNQLDAGPSSNVGSLNSSNNNMVQMLQKPQPVPESSSSINVQPSCLIVPSQTLNDFHLGNNLGPGNQAHPSNRSSKTDYRLISSQSNNPTLRFGQVAGTDFRNIDVLTPGVSTSPSVSSSSVRPENNTGLWVSTSSRSINPANTLKGFSPNSCKVPLSKETRTGGFPDQGPGRSLGFVGKGTSIPSRFAADDIESPTSERAYDKISMDGNMDIVVKQEPSLDNMESAKVGIPVGQYFAANDFMSVLSK